MATTVTKALAFAFLLQVALAAPNLCNCACNGGGPIIIGGGSGYGINYGGGYDVSVGGGVGVGIGGDVVYGGGDVVYRGGDVVYGGGDVVYGGGDVVYGGGSVGPAYPVGGTEVVGNFYGPSNSYSTAPSCQTSSYVIPGGSQTSISAGPVQESSSISEGHCSTCCAATRARCGGTTKSVVAGSPVIINQGSASSSDVTVIDSPKSVRSTRAGTPQVSNQVYGSGASYGGVTSYGGASYGDVTYGGASYGGNTVSLGSPVYFSGNSGYCDAVGGCFSPVPLPQPCPCAY